MEPFHEERLSEPVVLIGTTKHQLTAEERRKLKVMLEAKCTHIQDGWREALPNKCFGLLDSDELQRYLASLTEQIVALLLSQSWNEAQARGIGAQLAALPGVEPELLGQAQIILAKELIEEMPPTPRALLGSRCVRLLGELATGFVQQMQVNILRRQEQLRLSLMDARKQAEMAQRETEAWYRQLLEERTRKRLEPDLHGGPGARLAAGNGRPPPPPLTVRECGVLQLVVRGATDQSIAETLFISPRTVQRHLQGIYDKLQVSSRVEAAVQAVKLELVEV